MEDWKYTIAVSFPDMNLRGMIFVRDNFAMLKLDDVGRTRELFREESRVPGKKMIYDSAREAIIEFFDDMNAEDIVEILKGQMKKAGGDIDDVTSNT